MGRRTLPDDKVVNALSIARYDATYHSNLSTALLNSSLFQFISKCAAARSIGLRESRNDRLRFQKPQYLLRYSLTRDTR